MAKTKDILECLSEPEIRQFPDFCAAVRELASEHDELLDAMRRIAAHTDPEDDESYRSDDREGCLDAVHALSSLALSKATASA